MTSTQEQQDRTISKVERDLLIRHDKTREAYREAFADVETSDADQGSPEAAKLREQRDKYGEKLHQVAEKLREKGYTLEHDDSEPAAPEHQRKPKAQPKRVFNSPAILATVESEALTISEIAERVGIEPSPALKRRVSWLTDHDKVLTRKVEGRGKSRTERFQKVAS